MQTLTGRFTNFFRDKLAETGPLVSGGAPSTMAEAIAEVVSLAQTNRDLVYWNTIVENDGPDGSTIYTTIDLTDYARDALWGRTEHQTGAASALRGLELVA